MERIKITTNPFFKEIVEICWRNAGGTETLEKVELSSSYQELIPEAIKGLIQQDKTKALYPKATIPPPTVIRDLWRGMVKFGLAGGEKRKEKGIVWKHILFNPGDEKFEWDCKEKVRYRWLEGEVKPAVKTEEITTEARFEIPDKAVELFGEKPERVWLHLQEVKKQMEQYQDHEIERINSSSRPRSQLIKHLQALRQAYQEKLVNIKTILEDIDESLTVWQRIQSLEEEKEKLLSQEVYLKSKGDENIAGEERAPIRCD